LKLGGYQVEIKSKAARTIKFSRYSCPSGHESDEIILFLYCEFSSVLCSTMLFLAFWSLGVSTFLISLLFTDKNIIIGELWREILYRTSLNRRSYRENER